MVVDGASQADALFLATGQVDALLAYFGLVASGQNVEVVGERTRLDHSGVERLVQVFAEQDVVFERFVLNPRLLRHVRYAAVDVYVAG